MIKRYNNLSFAWGLAAISGATISLVLVLATHVQAEGGMWAEKAPLLTGRTGVQAGAIGGAVYAIGGANGGCPQPDALASEVYNPFTNKWTARAALPAPPGNGGQRSAFASAVVGGMIYAFGGGNCLTFFDDVQVYDPTTDSWGVRNPMPTARATGVAAAVNGKIYLIGGYSNPADSASSIAPTLEYDPLNDSWTTKADVPTPRISPSAAVISGKIYLVGGADPVTGTVLKTVEVYDPSTDKWTSVAFMSTPRLNPAVAALNGLLYAFGGSDASYAVIDSGEVYDPALNMWFEAPPLPAARVGAGAAVLGGVLYVIGGQTATVSGFATTFAFTPAPSVITVTIDIKPGSFPNSINLGSNGTVPVAILSTVNFDAMTVDPLSVTLAGAHVKLKGKGTPQASFVDINGDGLLDLVVHVSTEALQLSQADTEAILEGKTFGGKLIRGVDSIRIVP